MACTGPFKYGINPPVCGCKCSDEGGGCCPPPCCTSITLVYELGPAYDEDTMPDGCKCEDPTPAPAPAPAPPAFRAVDFENAEWDKAEEENWETINIGSHLIPFPKFMHKSKKQSENFVFALGGSCSLPCETVEVVLGVDSCCIEVIGSKQGETNFGPGQGIRMVGDGYVTASTTKGTCDFDIVINGTTLTDSITEVFVEDGDNIVVSLSPKGENAECCPVCPVDTICSPKSSVASNIFYRARSVRKGSKGYLNVSKLIERVQRLKRRNS